MPKIKDWNIKALTGYEPKTTVYSDFSIAEVFGISAICSTYSQLLDEWKNDIVYLTELSMALNWKIWEHHEKNDTFAKMYNDLWFKCCDFIEKTFAKDKEALSYFYRTTD